MDVNNPFGTVDEYIRQADQLELTLFWDWRYVGNSRPTARTQRLKTFARSYGLRPSVSDKVKVHISGRWQLDAEGKVGLYILKELLFSLWLLLFNSKFYLSHFFAKQNAPLAISTLVLNIHPYHTAGVLAL